MCEENQTPEKLNLLQSVPQTPNQEILRHILLGDYGAILRAIQVLAACNYAEPKHWSPPMPTGRSGEYLSILTKREAASPIQES
ncbi:MAG TPA: hypothetical protein V6D29_02535 [Leptolyngbyaceae cyanobacterium]